MKYCLCLVVILSLTSLAAQEAKFTYQFHSNEIKGGKFSFTSPDGTLSFEANASAGYLVASNNPYFQSTKNTGPIPNGTWEIFAVKNESQFTFRLRPTDDVTITTRDGFLIHGTGADSTPEESSKGCIILDRESRKKLYAAFKKYGTLKLKVTNFITGSGRTS